MNAILHISTYVSEIRKQSADSTYNLRTPQQLNFSLQMSYLFVDSTNCSGFRMNGCGFRKMAYFWSGFERYSVSSTCLWNPKQQRRSKKSSKVANSAKNLILTCCGISQCTECTVWPRNAQIWQTSRMLKTKQNVTKNVPKMRSI